MRPIGNSGGGPSWAIDSIRASTWDLVSGYPGKTHLPGQSRIWAYPGIRANWRIRVSGQSGGIRACLCIRAERSYPGSTLRTQASTEYLEHCLVCSSAHCLVCSSAHCQVCSSAHCLVCSSEHCLVCSSGHCLVCSSKHCLVCSSEHCLVCSSEHCLVVRARK